MKDMKKVFLRLLVAGVILAVIVVVLLNTVFKADASIETHNEIAKSLTPNGQIVKLSTMLDDEEVISQFPDIVLVVDSEIETLKHLYTKIMATEQNSDKKTDKMLKSLKSLENSLKKSNDKLTNIKTTKADGDLKKKMVQDLQSHLTDSMVSLKNLNQSLIEYLIDYYYKNSYDTVIAISYLKTAVAQNIITASDDANRKLYKTLSNALISDEEIGKLSINKDFNTLLFNCKKVDLYKIITDSNYISTLNAENTAKANQMRSCIATLFEN